MTGASWTVTYVTQSEYASMLDSEARQKTSYYDGQVLLVASYKGRSSEFNTEGVRETAFEVAKTFGEVRAWSEIDEAAAPTLEFRVEFDMIKDAKDTLKTLVDDDPHTMGVSALPSPPARHRR